MEKRFNIFNLASSLMSVVLESFPDALMALFTR